NCTCGEETCECGENCGCDHECHCEENKDYLKDLLRVQAEFDNYRKRMTTALGDARQDGFMDAICGFLPALDSFKMATDMITDKNTLMGIKFIEKGILDTLSKMGVDEIDTNGKFNPKLHQAIDTEESAEYESGDIIKVASKGFTYKGKVIRYSQVIVKK
ncbi:MAG: nucleotide exchange factor GrpE, partial [Clostridia bacterium]|nr:nucleotide exchange factor GrpE [Clostridia bacterium]